MTEPLLLDPTTTLPERPFTDPAQVYYDHLMLESMLFKVCLMLQRLSPPEVITGHLEKYYPEPDGRYHRIIFSRPQRLMAHPCPAVVGFIGHRRPGSDLDLMMEMGKGLIAEFRTFEPLLSYSTKYTLAGNFANLVLLEHEQAIEHWRRSQLHRHVAEVLSPTYYAWVKIYNGVWDKALPMGHHILLQRVKYFDFAQTPVWRAVRNLNTAPPESLNPTDPTTGA